MQYMVHNFKRVSHVHDTRTQHTHTTYNSNVKAIQKLNETELKLGLDSKSSWHDQYKDSAYIFVGEK